jgi:hypothetical protein
MASKDGVLIVLVRTARGVQGSDQRSGGRSEQAMRKLAKLCVNSGALFALDAYSKRLHELRVFYACYVVSRGPAAAKARRVPHLGAVRPNDSGFAQQDALLRVVTRLQEHGNGSVFIRNNGRTARQRNGGPLRTDEQNAFQALRRNQPTGTEYGRPPCWPSPPRCHL